MKWFWQKSANPAPVGTSSSTRVEPWLFGALGGGATASGARVGVSEALGLIPFMAAISLLAGDIAKTPLLPYERQTPDALGEPSYSHPLYFLLNVQANPWQPAFNWKEQVAAQLLVYARHYSVIWRDRDGRPNGLYPIHPSRVMTLMGSGGELYYQVLAGTLYETMIARGQAPLIPAENMLVIHGLALDGFEGLNPLALIRESLGMALSAEKHAAKLFNNGTRLSGVLSTEKILDADVIKRIVTSWNDMYSGTDNAHKVAMLEDSLKFTPLGMTAADAQLLESRKFQAEEIARFFHIPPHKLGMLDRATFSNVEQQQIDYVTGVLATLAGRIESAIEATLLRPQERATHYVDFDFANLLRGDLKTVTEAAARLVLAAVATPNEVRRWLRLPPIVGGDKLYPPPNTPGGAGAAALPADPPDTAAAKALLG